jgi:flagellar biosynthetic protein FliR
MNWFMDAVQFWLVASRLSGMLLMIPAISQVPIPIIARVSLVVWLSIALLPSLPPVSFPFSGAFDFTIGMSFEFFFGLGIGYVVRLAFAIVEIGGTMLDAELGYRAAQQFNPGSAISGGPIGRMMVLVSLLYFWLLDYFSIMVLALRESFLIVPPFAFNMPSFDLQQIFRVSTGIFAGGLMMAAPILALMFVINVGFGFIAKSVQGINFFFEVFILRILIGLIGLLLFLPLILFVIRDQFAHIIPSVSYYMRGFTP